MRKSTVDLRLGPIWWLLDPLVMMAIYYFVVHLVLGRGGDNYHVFLLSGLVVWQWFARAMTRGTNAISSSVALITKIRIPLFTLLLAPVIVNMFYAIIGFMVVMLFAGQIPVFATLSLIPLMLVQCILTLALISFLSILRVFFADTGRLL
ncbi:MAG: hypothetical protein MJA83_06040, partial [Gammaproteobacteria bacterium]|nr:hypothetical protein [Gammaproteobacteria bacterium]